MSEPITGIKKLISTTKQTQTRPSFVTVIKSGASPLTSAILKRKDDTTNTFDFETCENNFDKKFVMKCHHGGQCFKSKSYKYGHPYFRQFCV